MLTPFMSLPVPSVLTTKGPDYATQIDQSFTLLDSHDHTPGKGRPITVAALNINSDISMGGFNLTQVRATRLINESTTLTTPFDVTSLYAMGGDLYYNNAGNVPVQVTAGNSINASSVGGIGGDYATSSASVNYSSTTKEFAFFSSAGTRAYMDCGHINVNAALPDVPYLALNIPNVGSAYLGYDPIDTILATSIKPSGSSTFINRNLLHYTCTSAGNAPIMSICEQNPTDTLPTIVGQATTFAALDRRVPLQVATNGANTEVYAGANKDAALGVGLGYLNATVASASTLGGTGGVLRMFGTDPLYFATQTTIAGLMDNNGNWGFSGGGLTTLLTSARVQVLSNAGQDGLRLDTASGAAASVSLASGGTTKWKMSAASAGPLTITDATGTSQHLLVDAAPTVAFTTPQVELVITNPLRWFVAGMNIAGNAAVANIAGSGATALANIPIAISGAGTLTQISIPYTSTGGSFTFLMRLYTGGGALQASTSTVTTSGSNTFFQLNLSLAYRSDVTDPYVTLSITSASASTANLSLKSAQTSLTATRYTTGVSV